MSYAFAEQRFGSYEDVEKWPVDWFTAKGDDFYWRGVYKLPKKWGKYIAGDGAYFERSTFMILPILTCCLRKKSAFHTCTHGKCVIITVICY